MMWSGRQGKVLSTVIVLAFIECSYGTSLEFDPKNAASVKSAVDPIVKLLSDTDKSVNGSINGTSILKPILTPMNVSSNGTVAVKLPDKSIINDTLVATPSKVLNMASDVSNATIPLKLTLDPSKMSNLTVPMLGNLTNLSVKLPNVTVTMPSNSTNANGTIPMKPVVLNITTPIGLPVTANATLPKPLILPGANITTVKLSDNATIPIKPMNLTLPLVVPLNPSNVTVNATIVKPAIAFDPIVSVKPTNGSTNATAIPIKPILVDPPKPTNVSANATVPAKPLPLPLNATTVTVKPSNVTTNITLPVKMLEAVNGSVPVKSVEVPPKGNVSVVPIIPPSNSTGKPPVMSPPSNLTLPLKLSNVSLNATVVPPPVKPSNVSVNATVPLPVPIKTGNVSTNITVPGKPMDPPISVKPSNMTSNATVPTPPKPSNASTPVIPMPVKPGNASSNATVPVKPGDTPAPVLVKPSNVSSNATVVPPSPVKPTNVSANATLPLPAVKPAIASPNVTVPVVPGPVKSNNVSSNATVVPPVKPSNVSSNVTMPVIKPAIISSNVTVPAPVKPSNASSNATLPMPVKSANVSTNATTPMPTKSSNTSTNVTTATPMKSTNTSTVIPTTAKPIVANVTSTPTKPTTNGTVPVVPVILPASNGAFSCMHGEKNVGTMTPKDCPSKKCVSMYNYQSTYWATTCYDDQLTGLSKAFPQSRNMTFEYYTCDKSLCNGKLPSFADMIQLPTALMGGNDTNHEDVTNGTGKLFPITGVSYRLYQSPTTVYTIVGKPQPKAWFFRVNMRGRNSSLAKLHFSVRKNFVSLFQPEENIEHRKPFTVPLDVPITIVFNGSNLIINNKPMFKLSFKYENLSLIFYGGDWAIIESYATVYANKTWVRQNITTKVDEKSLPVATVASCPNAAFDIGRVRYFVKPFEDNDHLKIAIKNTSTMGVFDIGLMNNACDPLNIPLYIRVAYSFNTTTKPPTSLLGPQMLSNDIVPGAIKITSWSRVGGQWKDGNVTQIVGKPFEFLVKRWTDNLVYDIRAPQVMTINSAITTSAKLNGKIPKYIYVNDPWHSIQNITVG